MKRQSDASKCAYLTVIAYQFLPAGVALESKQQELLTLKSMGFNVPRFEMCQGLTDVEKLYQEYSQTIRKSLDYDVDGLVVDINDRSVRDSLGELNNRPKGSVALKFPHEKQPTKLLDIEWQVGNSGRVTPVAVFEPVTLAGAQIQRASLAGIRQVEHLKLYKGCNILVARRNDCIPRVEANLDLGIENDL
jgi:DNA ligase (NAD+)